MAALEQDANGGKTPFDAPVPALHEEPGAYVPQAKNCPITVLVFSFLSCALYLCSLRPVSVVLCDSALLAAGLYSTSGTHNHHYVPDRLEPRLLALQC